MSNKGLFKAAGTIVIITVLSKVAGFIRDAAIASAFGTTYRTDAYNMSLTIPTVLFGLFGAAISTTFIPMLSEIYEESGKEGMFRFANSIMNILLIISIILFSIGWKLTPQIVHLIAPSFFGKTYDLTVELTKISLLNILFMSMTAGFVGILQSLNDFTAPSLNAVVISIPVIIYVFLGTPFGIQGLVIATITGYVLQVFIQIPWLIKHRYRYSLIIDIRDKRIGKMFKLITPVIIGTGVLQINTLVDRIMASGLPEGSIAALDFASKLNSMVYGVFALAVVTVVYPALSRESISNNLSNFRNYISKSINNINLTIIPSAIGMMVIRFNIISVIFRHGAFDKKSVEMTASALFYLAIGMIFYGMRDVCNRAFYALKDTKTPMINGIIGVLVCIFMNLILVRYMGMSGLALSATLSAVVCTILLMKDLRHKVGGINGKEILESSSKILLSSCVMAIGVHFANEYLLKFIGGFKGEVITLLLSIIFGAVIYLSMLLLLKVKEINIIIEFAKRKFKVA